MIGPASHSRGRQPRRSAVSGLVGFYTVGDPPATVGSSLHDSLCAGPERDASRSRGNRVPQDAILRHVANAEQHSPLTSLWTGMDDLT